MTETTQILDGKKVSSELKDEAKVEVEKMDKKPHLVAIMVGDDPASQTYINSKIKSCKYVGIRSTFIKMDSDTSEEMLLTMIDYYNTNDDVTGILVQLPLPDHISQDKVIKRINPKKDVDGFHVENIGRMTLNLPTILPATPFGIMELLRRYDINLKGKNCVVVGRSNIVGLPISIMMGHDDMCTVTSCHINTKNLKEKTKEADILIVAVGKPNLITEDMVKDGAVVVDVGINRVEDNTKEKGYKLVGDVDFENVSKKSSFITPVPGGIGPMTIASLIRNTIYASKLN